MRKMKKPDGKSFLGEGLLDSPSTPVLEIRGSSISSRSARKISVFVEKRNVETSSPTRDMQVQLLVNS